MEKKIISFLDLKDIRSIYKNIGFCSGCFDILHMSHVLFFNKCKDFCDLLVVGVARDNTIKKVKGEDRPINNEKDRLNFISYLENVDYVVFNDDILGEHYIDDYRVISDLKPDVIILNDKDRWLDHYKKICNELDIELILLPRILEEYSTTEIIKQMKNEN